MNVFYFGWLRKMVQVKFEKVAFIVYFFFYKRGSIIIFNLLKLVVAPVITNASEVIENFLFDIKQLKNFEYRNNEILICFL